MLIIKQISIIIAAIYLFFLIFLYFQQRSFIFFPIKTTHRPPDKTGIRQYSYTQEKDTLRGWLVGADAVTEKLLIYYGGNAEDIFNAIDDFSTYEDTVVLLVNYRGYGSSDGHPGEAEFFQDALSIFDDIQKVYAPDKVFLMGRSLGSGVATYVAGKRGISGLILITPFDSVASLAQRQFPFLPTTLLLKHTFSSIDHIRHFPGACLVIYGGRDQTVPPRFTKRLIEHIPGDTTIVYIANADHNNIQMFQEYKEAIKQFIR